MRKAMDNVGNDDENIIVLSRLSLGSDFVPVKSWNAPDPSCWRVHYHEESLIGSFNSAEDFGVEDTIAEFIDEGITENTIEELVRRDSFVNKIAIETPPPRFTISPPNSIESDTE